MNIPPFGTVNLFDYLNRTEANRRAEWHRRNAEAIRQGRRVDVSGVCGESEDLKTARQMGNLDEARCRRGENNG